MVPTRIVVSALIVVALGALPFSAGPVSHAIELDEDRSVLFVDLAAGRVLRLREGQLSVVADLAGKVEGDGLQNLVLSISGELYLGQKKAVWSVLADGSLEPAKPPKELKVLFLNRPGDLAPDGSVYVARDFRNIERSLPGGDTHPVLATDLISKIHSLSVTPYGRVFFSNNAEIAKLNAQGEVAILQELDGDVILGLAAQNENTVLVLRRNEANAFRLERLQTSGNIEVLVSADQIAAVTKEVPVQIVTAPK